MASQSDAHMMVTIVGISSLKARIAQAGRRALPMLAAALYSEANEVMNESRPLVPVDTGVLKASGVIKPPSIKGTTVTVDFGYGGAARAYAVVQHDTLWFHHDVGQALYLSTPFWNHLDVIQLSLANKMGTMLS